MATLVLRRIDPMSYAKVYAVIAAAIGFVFGAIYALVMMAFASTFGVEGWGVLLGLLVVIVFPVFYGVIAFLMGLLSAWIYNVAAGRVGGIELEFDQYE